MDTETVESPTQTIKYVTAYEITRHYGGPEEGGWWFNITETIDSVPMVDPTDENLDLMVEGMKTKHADRVHGDIYSVRGGVALWVTVEDTPGEFEEKERPRYE